MNISQKQVKRSQLTKIHIGIRILDSQQIHYNYHSFDGAIEKDQPKFCPNAKNPII